MSSYNNYLLYLGYNIEQIIDGKKLTVWAETLNESGTQQKKSCVATEGDQPVVSGCSLYAPPPLIFYQFNSGDTVTKDCYTFLNSLKCIACTDQFYLLNGDCIDIPIIHTSISLKSVNPDNTGQFQYSVEQTDLYGQAKLSTTDSDSCQVVANCSAYEIQNSYYANEQLTPFCSLISCAQCESGFYLDQGTKQCVQNPVAQDYLWHVFYDQGILIQQTFSDQGTLVSSQVSDCTWVPVTFSDCKTLGFTQTSEKSQQLKDCEDFKVVCIHCTFGFQLNVNGECQSLGLDQLNSDYQTLNEKMNSVWGNGNSFLQYDQTNSLVTKVEDNTNYKDLWEAYFYGGQNNQGFKREIEDKQAKNRLDIDQVFAFDLPALRTKINSLNSALETQLKSLSQKQYLQEAQFQQDSKDQLFRIERLERATGRFEERKEDGEEDGEFEWSRLSNLLNINQGVENCEEENCNLCNIESLQCFSCIQEYYLTDEGQCQKILMDETVQSAFIITLSSVLSIGFLALKIYRKIKKY